MNRQGKLRLKAEKRLLQGRGGAKTLKLVNAPKGATVQEAQAYYKKHAPGPGTAFGAYARQQRNPEAYGPGTNLTPMQLRQNVNAQAQLRYGPQLNQVGTQLKQVDPIYDAYRQSLQAAQAGAQAGAQQAYGAITGASQGLERATGAQDQQMLAKMQQDAAARGATVDPAIAAQMAQAAASRQAGANTQAGLSQQLGQNQNAYLAALQAVGNTQRENRRQGLQTQQGDLLGQQGAFKVSDAQALKDAAVKQAIEYGTLGVSQANAKTSAGLAVGNLSLKQQSQKETRRHNKASEKNTATNPSRVKTQQEIDFFNQHGYYPRTGSGVKGASGSSSFTPTQVRNNRQSYRGALSWASGHHPTPGEESDLIHALLAPKGGSQGQTVTVHDPTTGKIIYNPDGTPKTVRKGGTQGGFGLKDPLLARAVAEMAIYGGVLSAKTQRSFQRNYGIKLKVHKQSTGPNTGRNPGERPT